MAESLSKSFWVERNSSLPWSLYTLYEARPKGLSQFDAPTAFGLVMVPLAVPPLTTMNPYWMALEQVGSEVTSLMTTLQVALTDCWGVVTVTVAFLVPLPPYLAVTLLVVAPSGKAPSPTHLYLYVPLPPVGAAVQVTVWSVLAGFGLAAQLTLSGCSQTGRFRFTAPARFLAGVHFKFGPMIRSDWYLQVGRSISKDAVCPGQTILISLSYRLCGVVSVALSILKDLKPNS